jgi:hypothetical protein
MTTLDSIKNNLISRIMATKKEKKAINNFFDSTGENNMVSLNTHQIEMLMMSERDIENDKLISAEDLEISDSERVS